MVGQRVKATTVYVSGIQLKFSILSVPQNHHICLLLQPMRQKNKSQIWVWYDIDVTCDSSVTFNYEASICLKSIHCLKCKNKKIFKKMIFTPFFFLFLRKEENDIYDDLRPLHVYPWFEKNHFTHIWLAYV